MYACSMKNEFDNFAFLCILIIIPSCLLKVLKQMHGCMIVSMASSSRASKCVWMKEEEATLVACMVELVSADGSKSNNGTTSANDGREVAGMQCTCDQSDRLSHKDVEALIPGNRRNARPVMQWVWLE